MIRRILIELALFGLPFIVFLLYRAASRDLSVKDRWPLTTLMIAGGVLAVGALAIVPLFAKSSEGKCFVAARYENGVSIPGRMVECDEVTVPQREAPPPPSTPVAPRDRETGGQ